MRGTRWRRLAIVPLTVAVLLPTGSAPAPAHRPAARAPTAPAGPADHAGHAAPAGGPAGGPALPAGRAGAKPAAEQALRLQALLGQHSTLATGFMRGRLRGDDDFVQAADAALGRNTQAMTALVGDMFGAAAGQQFEPLWRDHVVALFGYAGAVAEQDDAARDAARKNLTDFELRLGTFFAGASGGRLSPADARTAVLQHVDHLLEQADAYAEQDFARADRTYREAYRHTYDMGGVLAGALLPPADAATLREPIWQLRAQLGKLLAEHVFLVVDVTRAAATDAPDFTAAAELVDDNTRALATAMDSLFGADAAGRFQTLWASHVDQLVAYAAAGEDRAKRDLARANLRAFEGRLASFLEGATERRLTTAGLTQALVAHDDMLLRHADAFAERDYSTAHTVAYETYDHMSEVARQLADAFGATVAAGLPVGGAQTGHGGMAGR
ncbi:hypothetical protein [Spirilliplanes yamanashiensis]|uniref:Copper amine oxidase n=1 Tax=Spirilliplanes yamanashiensis TaxID=42233 RepID=A0A8J3Y735_9ACTN|nr:hypothetical protein [Spirilliplanes yamanashiensis]MDP9817331.1 hypothetical protein [Spirilliplanes yamanashiensis]GIJ03018.1 hypothetical protein Sya03_23700 [Spirilliplanes yamanashiensis]